MDNVVVRAVNRVGVDLNTASKYLLAYVSGLGPKLAENIIKYREENGVFKNRESLKLVPRMGNTAYQQAAGFLRVKKSDNPLDNSAVHPENYAFVKSLAKKGKIALNDLVGSVEEVSKIKGAVTEEERSTVGAFTIDDIFTELEKPGRDPRQSATVFAFSDAVKSISDLKEGMKLNGIVTNVTDFGAFVNIGIKENGLIHKTQLSNEYVNNPTDFIQIHDNILVKVISIDRERKRIGLSLKDI